MSLCPSSWCQTFVFNNYLTFPVVRWNAMTGPNKLANLDLGCDYHPPVWLFSAAAPHVFATMTSWHLGQWNHGSQWFWRWANLKKRWIPDVHDTHDTSTSPFGDPNKLLNMCNFCGGTAHECSYQRYPVLFWQWTGSIYKRLGLPESIYGMKWFNHQRMDMGLSATRALQVQGLWLSFPSYHGQNLGHSPTHIIPYHS